MEELLGNYAGARAIFERWMQWEPEEKAWLLYVRFEERCEEVDRARCVFERLLSCRPCQSTFLKYSKFEEKHFNIIKARASFEKAVWNLFLIRKEAYFHCVFYKIEVLPENYLDEDFFIKFAQFEERQKEFERYIESKFDHFFFEIYFLTKKN
jgi:crooked neck